MYSDFEVASPHCEPSLSYLWKAQDRCGGTPSYGTYIQSQYVAEGILNDEEIAQTVSRIESAMNLAMSLVIVAINHTPVQVKDMTCSENQVKFTLPSDLPGLETTKDATVW